MRLVLSCLCLAVLLLCAGAAAKPPEKADAPGRSFARIKWAASLGPGWMSDPLIDPEGRVVVATSDKLRWFTEEGAVALEVPLPRSRAWELLPAGDSIYCLETLLTPSEDMRLTHMLWEQGIDDGDWRRMHGPSRLLTVAGGEVQRYTRVAGRAVNGLSALKDDTLIYAAANGSLVAWGLAEDTVRWTHEKDRGNVCSHPVIGPDGSIYVCFGFVLDLELHAFSPDGALRWSTECSLDESQVEVYPEALERADYPYVVGDVLVARPTLDESDMLYLGWGFHELSAYRAADGALTWAKRIKNLGSALVVGADGRVYVYDTRSIVWTVSSEGVAEEVFDSRRLAWSNLGLSDRLATDGAGRLFYLASGDSLKCYDRDGEPALFEERPDLYCFSTSGRLLWRVQLLEQPFSDLALGPNGDVYVCCRDGVLYAVGPVG